MKRHSLIGLMLRAFAAIRIPDFRLVAALVAVVFASRADAQIFTPTTAGTYAWTNAANWNTGVPASSNTTVVTIFANTSTALTGAITLNADPSPFTLNSLTLNGLAVNNTATAVNIGTLGSN